MNTREKFGLFLFIIGVVNLPHTDGIANAIFGALMVWGDGIYCSKG